MLDVLIVSWMKCRVWYQNLKAEMVKIYLSAIIFFYFKFSEKTILYTELQWQSNISKMQPPSCNRKAINELVFASTSERKSMVVGNKRIYSSVRLKISNRGLCLKNLHYFYFLAKHMMVKTSNFSDCRVPSVLNYLNLNSFLNTRCILIWYRQQNINLAVIG